MSINIKQGGVIISDLKCDSVLSAGVAVQIDVANTTTVIATTSGYNILGLLLNNVKNLSSGVFGDTTFVGYRDPLKVSDVNQGDYVAVVTGPAEISNFDQYNGTVTPGAYLMPTTGGKLAATTSGVHMNLTEQAVAYVVVGGTAGTDTITIK
jgi:hypothetical protein